MPPLGSTPSKPASFIALNFSITDPLKPIVEYMIAFLILRLDAAMAAGPAAATTAAVTPAIFRNARRFCDGFIFIGTIQQLNDSTLYTNLGFAWFCSSHSAPLRGRQAIAVKP